MTVQKPLGDEYSRNSFARYSAAVQSEVRNDEGRQASREWRLKTRAGMTGSEVRGRHQERDRAEMLNEQEMEKNELFTKTHTVSQGIVS